jgi:hypothetical protein
MRLLNRSLFILGLSALALVLPLVIRLFIYGYNWRDYTPLVQQSPVLAVTPIPTQSPKAQSALALVQSASVGMPVILVDIGHWNRIDQHQFQPFADALAAYGLRLEFWSNDSNSDNGVYQDDNGILRAQDRSADLAQHLRNAVGLIVVDSQLSWTELEQQVVDDFVEDGGRLLLISDPNMYGAQVNTLNDLATQFGLVFESGYLYDTTDNDDLFIHIPAIVVAEVEEEKPTLYTYGARSVSGQILPILQTNGTTFSSYSADLTNFTLLGTANPELQPHFANVMALGDFDVLTDPFIERHDNRQILSYIVDFFAEGRRRQRLADYPSFLGKQVSFLAGESVTMDAGLLTQSAQLQTALHKDGRTLSLLERFPAFFTPNPDVTASTAPRLPLDLIYVATFSEAQRETPILARSDLSYVHQQEGAPARLELKSGVQLAADQTLLILRWRPTQYTQVVAVLGESQPALRAGIHRLVRADFADCIAEVDRLFCPFSSGQEVPQPVPHTELQILIVDGSPQFEMVETEANFYAAVLSRMGYTPGRFDRAAAGLLTDGVLIGYDWVIWSGGNEPDVGPESSELETLINFVSTTGKAVTISGLNTGWLMSSESASPILDVWVTGEIAALVEGFPHEPIPLAEDLSGMPASILSAVEEGRPVLSRGPQSPEQQAPLLVVFEADYGEDGDTNAILVLGMPIQWLPDLYADLLVQNMALWIGNLP